MEIAIATIIITIFVVLSITLFTYLAYILSPWQLKLMDDKEYYDE